MGIAKEALVKDSGRPAAAISAVSGKHSSALWLILSSLGLSFCIAASKVDRYTALWNVGTISLLEDCLIVVLLILGTAFLMWLARKHVIYRSLSLLVVLNISQVGYFIIKTLETYAGMPGWLSLLSALLAQSPVFLFLIYAGFFLKAGIKKSIAALATSMVVAGILQMVTAFLPHTVSLVLICLFLPISTVLLLSSDRLRTPDLLQKEQEDKTIETENRTRRFEKKDFIEYCIDLFLLNTLGILLFCSGMALQDGGQLSAGIQTLSGIGTLLGGALLVFALRYLHELEILDLLRILILPLIIASFYLSDYFSKSSVVMYFAPLGIYYSVLLLFVWAVPRQMSDENRQFNYTCITYLCFRIGWATGILTATILPSLIPGFSVISVVIVCFIGIFVLCILNMVDTFRRNHQTQTLAGISSTSAIDSATQLMDACELVGREYDLSPREKEVLVLLARGRNAQHIASTLIISDGTARTHITHIYRKMNIRSQQVLMDKVEQTIEKMERAE